MEFSAPAPPDSAAELMPKEAESFAEGLWNVVSAGVKLVSPSLSEAARCCLRVLGAALLIALVRQMAPGVPPQALELAGVAAGAALLLEPTASLISMGAASVEELQTYGKLLLGVLTGAMAAAGGVSGSAALYVGTAFFNALLTAAVTAVFLPMLWMLLALSIARDVHEIKKDNLRIIRGLEEEVAETYDHESMSLNDLLDILAQSTRQLLGEQRAEIRLECYSDENISVREHYRLLSVLKNLVTNAVEAIQGATGKGTVWVDCRMREENLLLTVKDDGPGITARGMKNLFQVGYSTKFDPGTGNINRGVGLPAVQYIVESLGGEITVDSAPGEGTCFSVTIPLASVTGGNT